ncbi:MAG: class I SAM-dependent methyltransferase [Calditrichota bacterium]
MNDAEKANRQWWDDLAEVHYRAYDLQPLREGRSLLDDVTTAEIGDVRGRSLLHLQCHIGSDTLSWARLGAEVTGVDFSEKSLAVAARLAEECNLKARWIHSDVESLPNLLNETFDIVVATQGVLCWVKDIRVWMRVAAGFLKPGGLFYLLDGHPFLDCFNCEEAVYRIKGSYFSSERPLHYKESCDYTDSGYKSDSDHYEWVWPLGEIITAAIEAGLRLEFLHEFGKTFHRASPGMIRNSNGWWSHPVYSSDIPHIFSLRAVKA